MQICRKRAFQEGAASARALSQEHARLCSRTAGRPVPGFKNGLVFKHFFFILSTILHSVTVKCTEGALQEGHFLDLVAVFIFFLAPAAWCIWGRYPVVPLS